MELKVKDFVSQIELNKNEVFLPLYESIVNSIISLDKVKREEKYINVFIERDEKTETDIFGHNIARIKTFTIVDNGEGFTKSNFDSFNTPYGQLNKKYGCKGIGRFTMLAMFERIEIVSLYNDCGKSWRRSFEFDIDQEISNEQLEELPKSIDPQTKIVLRNCNNRQLFPYTSKNTEEIAKGIMDHCFIYYLCHTLPQINVIEKNAEGDSPSLNVNALYSLESMDKEKDIDIGEYSFHLYVVKSPKTTSRKYNYVSLCANSRIVGTKKNLADADSLYTYPILENENEKYIDVYVVSDYLDKRVNSARTAFNIPEKDDVVLNGWEEQEDLISYERIIKKIAQELSHIYETDVVETKKRNIEEVKRFITTTSPGYGSFLEREDILNTIPPNLSDDKKDEYLHKVAYAENKKLQEKINKFVNLHVVNEEHIRDIIDTIKKKIAYDADSLVEYVSRRKAIIQLFEKMLEMKDDGQYELESMIHNLIFPMGFTNENVTYQYHNLWLLDDRFSTFRYIASDKSISSMSQKRSSKEPDLIMINDIHTLVNHPISFGDREMGDIGSMVIFEFKRPGDTAHQKKKNDYMWEFSDLVEPYFDIFMFGKDKDKKNWKGQVVKISSDTPKFGYVVMDEIPSQLVDYNIHHQWRKTPFGSYYKINSDLNLHIEAMDYHTMLKNAKERNNPFFDNLFTSKI